MKCTFWMSALAALVLIEGVPVWAQAQSQPTYSAKIPPKIVTPDTVQTRIGTLKFADGRPDPETVQKVYDNIDFARGVETFLSGMPATSVQAFCAGLDSVGIKKNQGFGMTEELIDARSLFLTANTTTVYVFACADLKDGPVVLQAPPEVLGPIDDAYFRWVGDIGLTGPDRGKGGKYLLVPPDYKGDLPKQGYYVTKSRTYGQLIFFRVFVKGGDLAAAVKAAKDHARLYPLSAAANPPPPVFVNTSGKQFNTISANDYNFYDELNAVIQREPADAFDPETVGLFAAIGIKKGQPFAPDARMKAILTDAIAVGNATARSLVFASRDERAKYYPDRQWFTPFVGGSYLFMDKGEMMLDARAMFFYYATGITPAMAEAKPGTGSAYAVAVRDSMGGYFDGSKTYKITLPGPIPAAAFWSFTVYDEQTRSLLETQQKLAGLDSTHATLKKNADGSATVWFGPKAPAGQEGNWVQTVPDKGWNVILRLYGPLQPWFDKSWKPGDFERVD